MDINIKTKYNIGDIIYIPALYHDLFPVRQPFIITNILLKDTVNSPRLVYEVKYNTVIDYMPEDWLFPTYEECAKWCDKRNKI